MPRDGEGHHTLTVVLMGDPNCRAFYHGSSSLRAMKVGLHHLFDPLWEFGPLRRDEAYRLLAHEMDMPAIKCHFRFFRKSHCRRAFRAIERLREKTMAPTTATCYVWSDHPNMRPMTEEEVLTYWTTMPRPWPMPAARDKFMVLLRAGHLTVVDPYLR